MYNKNKSSGILKIKGINRCCYVLKPSRIWLIRKRIRIWPIKRLRKLPVIKMLQIKGRLKGNRIRLSALKLRNKVGTYALIANNQITIKSKRLIQIFQSAMLVPLMKIHHLHLPPKLKTKTY